MLLNFDLKNDLKAVQHHFIMTQSMTYGYQPKKLKTNIGKRLHTAITLLNELDWELGELPLGAFRVTLAVCLWKSVG